MKMKKIIPPALMGFVVGGLFAACEHKKEAPAEEKEPVALEQRITVDSVSPDVTRVTEEDWVVYENQTNARLDSNQSALERFKTKLEQSDNKAKAEYREEANKLEEKNRELKAKMHEYKSKGKQDWESFKREFNHDMDELGHSLKDLTKDNVK